jgi:hypothetical protein
MVAMVRQIWNPTSEMLQQPMSHALAPLELDFNDWLWVIARNLFESKLKDPPASSGRYVVPNDERGINAWTGVSHAIPPSEDRDVQRAADTAEEGANHPNRAGAEASTPLLAHRR